MSSWPSGHAWCLGWAIRNYDFEATMLSVNTFLLVPESSTGSLGVIVLNPAPENIVNVTLDSSFFRQTAPNLFACLYLTERQ